jgi:hypothetical protein
LAPAQAVMGDHLPPLDYLLIAARLAELYEIVFPQHPEWLAELVDWPDEEAMAGAVARFLKRAGRFFPLIDECWELDLEIIEWRLYAIPVVPQGFDLWHDSWDEFYEPAPYLLHMLWHRDEMDSPDRPDEFTCLYPEHSVPRSLDPRRLVPTLRRMALPEPLAALPDLIEMLSQSTNNLWLDIGEIALMEGGGYPQWDPQEVAFLAEEWQKAKPICERVHALLAWHNDPPATSRRKVTAVHRLLLEAYARQEPGYIPQLALPFAWESDDDQVDTPALTAAAPSLPAHC